MPQNTPRGYTYPLYADVQNFPAQMQDLATDIDTDVQTQVNLYTNRLEQPACKLSSSGLIAVASNTDVTLTWALNADAGANNDFDPTVMFNAGTPTFVTLTETGIYEASAWGTWQSNGSNTTLSYAGLRLSASVGGVFARSEVERGRTATGTLETETFVSGLVQVLAPGVQISVIARHNLPVASGVGTKTFAITKVSDL